MFSSKVTKKPETNVVKVDIKPFGEQSGQQVNKATPSNTFVAATQTTAPQHEVESPQDHHKDNEGNAKDEKPVVHEDSYELGYSTAMDEGAQKLMTAAETLEKALRQIRDTSIERLERNQRILPTLATTIAQEIIRREVSLDEQIIISTVRKALNEAIDSEEFRIELNPRDLETISEEQGSLIATIQGLNNIILEANEDIQQGGCIVESNICEVDASIENQLRIFKNAIVELANT